MHHQGWQTVHCLRLNCRAELRKRKPCKLALQATMVSICAHTCRKTRTSSNCLSRKKQDAMHWRPGIVSHSDADAPTYIGVSAHNVAHNCENSKTSARHSAGCQHQAGHKQQGLVDLQGHALMWDSLVWHLSTCETEDEADAGISLAWFTAW
jgi:hypothetical protein